MTLELKVKELRKGYEGLIRFESQVLKENKVSEVRDKFRTNWIKSFYSSTSCLAPRRFCILLDRRNNRIMKNPFKQSTKSNNYSRFQKATVFNLQLNRTIT